MWIFWSRTYLVGCPGALENENKISKIINNSDNTTIWEKFCFLQMSKFVKNFSYKIDYSLPILKSPWVDGKVLQVYLPKRALNQKICNYFLRIFYVIWWAVNCIDSSTNNVWIVIFLWWKTVLQLSNTNFLCLKTYLKFSSFNSLPGFNNNKIHQNYLDTFTNR